jgi:hypothetical protein
VDDRVDVRDRLTETGSGSDITDDNSRISRQTILRAVPGQNTDLVASRQQDGDEP